ncbi:hypothetical protein [Legionella quateirensis]|uniref:Uncharacterized protein n=1 Tax=Legionella quateirensis TaxID=45072 RepID=A0A378KQW8_9GAMM|nr:hypothetical protein [Legionella quateirensis]KTD54772.1 hypothetical protein Lqua_0279 [Legionella quateirensis]STY16952.1 Uncharacterised protein [Legionella quateirensis]
MKKVHHHQPTHYHSSTTVVPNPVPGQQQAVIVTHPASIPSFVPGAMPQYNPNHFFPMQQQPTHHAHGHQYPYPHPTQHHHDHTHSNSNTHGHF